MQPPLSDNGNKNPPESENQNSKKTDKSYTASKESWQTLFLDEDIIDALISFNKEKPTQVQALTLKKVLDPARKRIDILIRAANGAGKTLAFLLPMIQAFKPGIKIAKDKQLGSKTIPNEIYQPQAVIVVDNNVLHKQLVMNLTQFAEYGESKNIDKLKFKIGSLDGAKHQPGDIIVAQAKSLFTRINRGNFEWVNMKYFALDEADQVLQGNRNQLNTIFKKVTEANVSTLICSATMQPAFLSFYQNYIKEYQDFQQEGLELTLKGVQNFYETFSDKKEMEAFLLKILFKDLYAQNPNPPQLFIFFNHVREAYSFNQNFDLLVADLMSPQSRYLKPITTELIASQILTDKNELVSQTIQQKNKIIMSFRNGETKILLGTNIVARGLDVRNCCLTINFEPPFFKANNSQRRKIDTDIFLHRVGRTGRHNDIGVALTLVLKEEQKDFIEKVKQAHGIVPKKIESSKQIVERVNQCIKYNNQK